MKKSLILIIGLLLLSSGIFYSAFCWVSEGKEAISVEETVLYGDRSAAKGITVTNRTHCGYHMFWNTVYTVGEKLSVKTDYKFSQAERREDEVTAPNMQIYSSINFAMSGDIELSDREANDMPIEVARDVAQRTPNGETHEEEVFLKDYYEFYPMQMDLYLTEGWIHLDNEQKDISDYFKIPVPQNHMVRVSVSKDTNGAVSYVEQSTTKGDAKITAGNAVIADNGAYCALSMYNENGEQVTLPQSLSGIHFLPFIEKGDGIVPSIKDMCRVYELDGETVDILKMMKDPMEDRLLLFTKETGAIMLSVIEMDTMKLIQKTTLGKEEDVAELWEVKGYDTFLVLIFNDIRFMLLERSSEGSYGLKFRGNFGQYQEIGENFPIYDAVMDFDGSRLAVAMYQSPDAMDQGGNGYQYIPIHSTYLMVFNQDGLAYAGKYDQSSDRLPRAENNFKAIRAINWNPLTVSID